MWYRLIFARTFKVIKTFKEKYFHFTTSNQSVVDPHHMHHIVFPSILNSLHLQVPRTSSPLSYTKYLKFGTMLIIVHYYVEEKNRNSRLPGHVNFDGQNHRFVRKGTKNGFISGFEHYFPDFG